MTKRKNLGRDTLCRKKDEYSATINKTTILRRKSYPAKTFMNTQQLHTLRHSKRTLIVQ